MRPFLHIAPLIPIRWPSLPRHLFGQPGGRLLGTCSTWNTEGRVSVGPFPLRTIKRFMSGVRTP
ncbi:hypothetical protein D7W81_19390 [Corallococcus aberystwythensis]|uniref:Uncharacterized protein n=1 Tax=Corallococcus aberystwythensis TaxID=2316722 RepID=A0A3A8QAB4_9BACT|nr:hypothetical protein D7W81_19390 [Corallococcus aberystwythensis]